MTDKNAGRDQRRHPRFPVGVTLDIQMRGAPDARVRGTIADWSAGGMTFKSDAEFETGMTLCLALPPQIRIRGEIRSVQGSAGGMRRYGIRFHKIGYAPARPAPAPNPPN